MLEVKVKNVGVKLQGQWKFKGETALVTKEEYQENAEYLTIINAKVEKPQGNPEPVKPQLNNEDEDKELTELREKAKDLGIKGAHNMKKENLIAKIEEVEKGNNAEDEEQEETSEGGETGEETTGEQPQE